MTIEYDVIKNALDPDTHAQIHREVDDEVTERLAKYKDEIDKTKKVGDAKAVVSDLKEAVKAALAKHLSLGKKGSKADAIADEIIDSVLQDKFGFDQDTLERQIADSKIENYQDFVKGHRENYRDAAVQSTTRYGIRGVQQHIQSPTKRREFFDRSEGDLGGYKWTDNARNKSDDAGHIGTMLSQGIGEGISKRIADRSKDHVYKP
tara:strand:+ start:3248 stop:3865 length:618 start_codon:yes stop_codon:yes gene_type:complete